MPASGMVPYSLAVETAKSNSESRIGGRGTEENRLEPECWPSLRPSFSFDKESRLFVIGSCFATNIEKYLTARGYTSDSSCGVETPQLISGHLNKYTPASIWEEISWAREIYDRDDTLTIEDAKKCFYQLSGDFVVDLQLHGMDTLDLAAAFERRKLVYDIYRRLFTCDVVVITLGLIESWYDTLSARYICEMPPRQALRERDRFRFHQLDYQTSYNFIVAAIDLIRKTNTPKILITTSPVVLQRTFTKDDVLVANMFSKSVLRAVAGQVVKDIEGIDYFPSYESVMLTRQNSVWMDDMMHVAEPFIAQIMARVESAYAPASFSKLSEDFDLGRRLVNAVSSHDFALAESLLVALGEPGEDAASDVYTSVAIIYWNRGDKVLAANILQRSNAIEISFSDLLSPVRLLIARWVGGKEFIIGVRTWLKSNRAYVFKRLFHSANWLYSNGNKQEAATIAAMVRPNQIRRVSVQRRLVAILLADGKLEEAKLLSEIHLDPIDSSV